MESNVMWMTIISDYYILESIICSPWTQCYEVLFASFVTKNEYMLVIILYNDKITDNDTHNVYYFSQCLSFVWTLHWAWRQFMSIVINLFSSECIQYSTDGCSSLPNPSEFSIFIIIILPEIRHGISSNTIHNLFQSKIQNNNELIFYYSRDSLLFYKHVR